MATLKQIEYLGVLVEQHPIPTKKHLNGKKPKDLGNRQASEVLDAIKVDVQNDTGHRAGSSRAIIKDKLIREGLSVNKTQMDLLPYVGTWKGLTFSRNVGGGRAPKTLNVQQAEFRHLVEQCEKELREKGHQHNDGKNLKQKEKELDSPTVYHRWRNRWNEHREFCESRAADGHPLDEVGLRPLEYGLAMLEQGLPYEALDHAMTLHWPQEARRTQKVKDYDVTKYEKKNRQEGIHAALPYIQALIRAGVPVALVGPKGTGKTTLAKQIADLMNLDFGFVSMTSGTSPSAFNGRPRIGGDGEVVQSVFERIFGGGGVFLFDELDAADENLFLMLQSALANGYFANTATGQIVTKHENFVPIAGMNTLGLGAGRDYTARNRLDAASLDRWNMGRVEIKLDMRIAEKMVDEAVARNEAL